MKVKYFKQTVMLAIMSIFCWSLAEAATISLAPSKDNTLYEIGDGSLSNGGGAYLFAGRTGSITDGKIRRAALAFDIAGAIPQGSTIKGASLTLHMSKTPSGDQTVTLQRLLSDWGEGDSNASGNEGGGAQALAGDATWLHTFSPNDLWTNPGGDFSVTVSASAVVGPVDFYTWESTTAVVQDVQSWLDDPDNNFGWLLRGNEDSSFTAKRFDSRNNNGESVWPSLEIEVTAPPLEDPIPETIPLGDVEVGLLPVADGLTAPNFGIAAPGMAHLLFVTDQTGILWKVNLATGNKTVFLDVSSRLVSLGIGGEGTFDERGLLGVAFLPDYQENGKLYTYTSEPVSGPADFPLMPPETVANHQTVILEWKVTDPDNPDAVVDPASVRELLRIDEPQFNHNGGALNFGHDGMLHISLGDGGNRDDQGTGHSAGGNGQDPSNVLGAILRIDPEGTNAPNGQYGIPADNPFFPLLMAKGVAAIGGQPGCMDGFCDEIFAYGFRNPFRFSFDSLTGDLYAGDVGQGDIEEIDVVVSGGNYGWRFKEGTFFFEPNGDDPGFVTNWDPGNLPPDLIDPIAQYDHDDGISVIGGFVYRSEGIKPLAGQYVFGDWSQGFLQNNGRLFYLDGDEIKEFQLLGKENVGLSLNGFGQDADGELYVMGNTTGTPFGQTGVVLKIVALCEGDFDGDGDADGEDLEVIAAEVGAACSDECQADLNGDGEVTDADVEIFSEDFGRDDCPVMEQPEV